MEKGGNIMKKFLSILAVVSFVGFKRRILEMNRKKVVVGFVVVVASLVLSSATWAALFSNTVAFGDSLSDNGNIYAATMGASPAPPNYFAGRFSNGPVWVEYLTTFVSDNHLDNYAYGGAETGAGGAVPGLLSQVYGYGVSNPSNLGDTLFTVWAGPNDFFGGGTDYIGSVNNIILALESLDALGAQHIMVPNMPDLGRTPFLYGNAQASGLSQLFNGSLQANLDDFAAGYAGTLYRLDTFSFLNGIEVGDYGFTNITDSCIGSNAFPDNYALGSEYLFWDDVHPTTMAHMILALEAERIITSQVPLPASLWLLGSGLIGLVGFRRKYGK
jgi:phospholipase/lecithinase/hemolysin